MKPEGEVALAIAFLVIVVLMLVGGLLSGDIQEQSRGFNIVWSVTAWGLGVALAVAFLVKAIRDNK